mmetsp:Transcript_15363/g.31308  ORF Transcript_15363/g.31308 Transcript_15363/m.31308 type:complete len:208 (+) Transcript_15363:2200-2823(+)
MSEDDASVGLSPVLGVHSYSDSFCGQVGHEVLDVFVHHELEGLSRRFLCSLRGQRRQGLALGLLGHLYNELFFNSPLRPQPEQHPLIVLHWPRLLSYASPLQDIKVPFPFIPHQGLLDSLPDLPLSIPLLNKFSSVRDGKDHVVIEQSFLPREGPAKLVQLLHGLVLLRDGVALLHEHLPLLLVELLAVVILALHSDNVGLLPTALH